MKANLRYRIKNPLILFALLTLVISFSSCRTDEVEVPPLTGPSGHRLFITMDANPEHLVIHDPGRPRETSVITVCLKNQLGQGVPGEGIKLRIANDQGSEINIGTLSDFNITTGSDGCARVIYTAPDSNEQRRSVRIYIRAILTNAAHAFEVTGQHALDLETSSVDPGPGDCIQGPGSPTADFTFQPSPGIINEPVCFDAQGSVDADGQIVDVRWNFGDGFTATGFNVCHTFTDFGLFNVTLTVEDEDRNCTQLTQIVEITQGVPGACTILISPTPVEVDELVRFTAIVTDDSRVRRFAWNFGDGSTATTSTNTVTHRYRAAGSFTLVVTMTDDQGNISTCQTTVAVAAPGAPDCVFTISPTSGIEEDETVFFNASQSVDVDGNPVETFTWDFGDGSPTVTETDPNISHAYSDAGSFTVTLTVTDANGISSFCTQTVTVIAGLPPTCEFTFSPTAPEVNQQVTFNAALSDDPDGNIVSFAWNFGDGSPTEIETIPPGDAIRTHTYTTAGTFTVTLTVTDDDGNDVTCSEEVDIGAGEPPVAQFSFTVIDNTAPFTVNFNGSASNDPDGSITNFLWNFGDGTTLDSLTDPTVSHDYADAGTFTVTLRVVDNDGNTSAPFQQDVTVGAAPTCSFTQNPNPSCTGDNVAFNGTGNDPDGGLLTFDWDFGDTGTSSQEDPNHVYNAAGNFTVTFTVTDDEQMDCVETATHTVLGTPTITQVSPDNASVGAGVVITGTGFATAAEGGSVTFNGTSATFSVNVARTQITTTVPVGATTGPLVVDNGCDTASTNFTVNP